MSTLISLVLLGMLWMLFSKSNGFFQKSILLPFSFVLIILSTLFDFTLFPSLGMRCSPFLIFNETTFLFSGMVNILTLVFMVIVVSEFSRKKLPIAHPVALLLFATFGAHILLSSTHLMTLFLGVEILSIPIYGLVSSLYHSRKSQEAGMKYFLMGSFVSTFLLLGIALLYAGTGRFDITPAALSFSPELAPLTFAGVLLVYAAMIFKLGVVPFQFWIADVYEGTQASVLGWMTTLVKVVIMGVLLLTLTSLLTLPILFMMLVFIPGVLSVLFGNLLTLFQTKLKRWIAYSGIAHLGYMLFAFCPFYTSTHFSLIIYLLTYVLTSLVFFVCLHFIEKKTDHAIENLSDLKGLYYRQPIVSVFFCLSLLSFAGFPPLPGFFGKLFVLMHLVSFQEVALICIAILGFLIGIFNYLQVALSLFDRGDS